MYPDDLDPGPDYACPILDKMRKMLKGAEGRARLNGRDFNLDLDHLFELYLEICPILGIEILWDNSGFVRHGSPSLDRINNTKGYIKGNVQIISWRANTLKKDYLLVEWEKMTNYMKMCDGNPIVITDEHFKESTTIDAFTERHIRAALKRNDQIEDISANFEIPIGEILKIARKLTYPQYSQR
jgi:hypothetical protein